MLVYLATYPRSGNSLLQRIMTTSFWRLPAQVKVAPRADMPVPRAEGWEISPPEADLRDPPIPGPLRDWLIRYRKSQTSEPARWGFKAVPQQLLTATDRRRLAAYDETFLIKTHHPPFPSYYPGEYVIQVVRHPGPVLRSYFRLLNAQAIKAGAPSPTLDQVIDGRIPFGSWSSYHAAWAAARDLIGPDAVLMKYADLIARQADLREEIGAFLRLPIKSEEPVTFDAYGRKHVSLGVAGTDDSFESFYSSSQLKRLYSLHANAVNALGLNL